jgi:hypothetical protein
MIQCFGLHCFRSRWSAPKKNQRGIAMQDSADKKMRAVWMLILFSFLSGFSAAATAVVPLIINA